MARIWGGGMDLSDRKIKLWGARYERVDEDEIPKRRSLRRIFRWSRTKTAKLGSKKRLSWRFRIFRVRLKYWVSPTLLLKRLRDAYVDMMINMANNGHISDMARAHPWTFTRS